MELTVGGNTYTSARQLDAFTQLALARKLAPGVPVLGGMVDPKNSNKDKSLLSVLMLAKLSDEDAEYVVRTCLSVVNRMQPNGQPAQLYVRGGGLMFSDMSMGDMLEITIAVIEENLGDFFRTALNNLDQESHRQT